ncbi:MAG: AAA family ATPase, partial [Planctomycetota bacterium]
MTAPFPAYPSLSRYIPLAPIEEVLGRVGRSIEAREAITLVIGPPGTGKSLTSQILKHRFSQTHDVVSVGATPLEDRSAVLRHILHSLGVRCDAHHEGDLHLALVDYVSRPDAPSGGLLLLVDEAQAMSPETLEAIRMTTNIMVDNAPRVMAVVFGAPRLEEVLIDSLLDAFVQRVATRCYTHPLSLDETRQYVIGVITGLEGNPAETITDGAISAVHHACEGVPRLINHLMTAAIDGAAGANRSLIDEPIVDAAWAQLQQLPSPMIEPPVLGGDENLGV